LHNEKHDEQRNWRRRWRWIVIDWREGQEWKAIDCIGRYLGWWMCGLVDWCEFGMSLKGNRRIWRIWRNRRWRWRWRWIVIDWREEQE
jgi:hypothetical protein